MTETEKPAISVIVPAYNCGRYLAEALDSALGQTLPPREVIVVDDGSTDDTAEVCAAYGHRARYVRQANQGVSAARNTALALATGDYFALLDADDVCAPDRLEKQAAALRARPGAVACFTGFWTFRDGGAVLASYPADPRDEDRPVLDYFWYAFIHPISGLVDRRAAAGLTFADVRVSEDRVYTARLRTRGAFVLLPEALYGYRLRGGQMTARYSEIDGYQSRLEWARANAAAAWPDKTPEDVEEGMWRSMAHYAAVHYWARRRDSFLVLRDHLRAHWPARLPPAPVLSWRWYPDWLWHSKAWLDRLRAPRPSPAARPAGGGKL